MRDTQRTDPAHSETRIQERLRRIIAMGGIGFLGAWALTAELLPDDFRWIIPRTPLGDLLYGLSSLTAPLCLLGLLGAVLVTAIYDPGGLCDRLAGWMLPRTHAGRARVERWSWLPLDVMAVLTPLLVFAAIPPYALAAEGTLGPSALRTAWGMTMSLLGATVFVAARLRTRTALGYVLGTNLVRFLLYVVIDPRLAPGVCLVTGQSLTFGTVVVLLVSAVRASSRTLDAHMNEVTIARLRTTRTVARSAVRERAEDLISGDVVDTLDLAARAHDANDVDGARRSAGATLLALDDALPTQTDPEVPAAQCAAALTRAAAAVDPEVPVAVTGLRHGTVPRAVVAHLEVALADALAVLVPRGTPAGHAAPVCVQIGPGEEGLLVSLVPDPSGPRGAELTRAAAAARPTLAALPGGRAGLRTERRRHRGRGNARPSAVLLGWEPGDALRPDPEDDQTYGRLRLDHLAPPGGRRRARAVLLASYLAVLGLTAFLTRDLAVSPALTVVSFAGYAVLCVLLDRAAQRDRRHPSTRLVPVLVSLAYTFFLVLSSLANIRDPQTFVMEVAWWQGTAVIVLLIWLAGASAAWYPVLTAVALGLVTAGWGQATGQDAGSLTGGGIPLVAAIALATGVTVVAVHEIRDAAAARRRERVVLLAEAFDQAARSERRAASRYVDDVARPYLVQLASRALATDETRRRAVQLAARVRDDRTAPTFRGTDVPRAAADARARGVAVTLQDGGGLETADPALRRRTAHVAVHALDAMVDGAISVRVFPPGRDHAALIVSDPAAEEQRRIEVLPDGSVVYDGIRVRPTKQVTR